MTATTSHRHGLMERGQVSSKLFSYVTVGDGMPES